VASNTGSTGSGSGSGSGSSSNSSAFQPPTSTVSPLAPWDPRSCTASGAEGT
jgi:hypothetical protein